MNSPTEVSPDTQLILDELRKLSAMQSELFADLAFSISRVAAPFAASVSAAPAAVSPMPAPSIVADNWGGLFDGGHNSDEQHGEARSIIADNWDGLFEQPAHILVEPAAIDAADSAGISIDVFGSNQIRDGNSLTSIAEDALLDASEELVLQRPCASESACLSLESALAYPGQFPVDAEAIEYISTPCSALVTTAPVSSSMSDLTCIMPVAAPSAATCVTAAPALSAAAVEDPDPHSALVGSGSVIIASRLSPVKWALRTTPLSSYDATVDDELAAGFVHFDAPLDRAVGRVGQVLAGAATLRADAVGAAGGGLLARVVAARSAQATCSTVCLAGDRNFADILVGMLWEEEMLRWSDDMYIYDAHTCSRSLGLILDPDPCCRELHQHDLVLHGDRLLCYTTTLAVAAALSKSGAYSIHATRVFEEMMLCRHQSPSASVPTPVFTLQLVLHARTAVRGSAVPTAGCQGLAINQDSLALQATELLTCGGEFSNSCHCNLIDVLGRSCHVVVMQLELFSSSDWVEQQPWPLSHLHVEFKCDSTTIRPSPWPCFLLNIGCSVSSVICWKLPWQFHPRQDIRSVQEFLTCLMVLSLSMDGCALIQELVQRKCGGNCQCFLLEVTGQKSRLVGGKTKDRWLAKQDLLQQFLSSGPSLDLGSAWHQLVFLIYYYGRLWKPPWPIQICQQIRSVLTDLAVPGKYMLLPVLGSIVMYDSVDQWASQWLSFCCSGPDKESRLILTRQSLWLLQLHFYRLLLLAQCGGGATSQLGLFLVLILAETHIIMALLPQLLLLLPSVSIDSATVHGMDCYQMKLTDHWPLPNGTRNSNFQQYDWCILVKFQMHFISKVITVLSPQLPLARQQQTSVVVWVTNLEYVKPAVLVWTFTPESRQQSVSMVLCGELMLQYNADCFSEPEILEFPWDPGGSILLHRLGGKPNLKERGMSAVSYDWAVQYYAMGRICTSLEAHGANTHKDYKRRKATGVWDHSIKQLSNRKIIFLLPIIPFSSQSAASTAVLPQILCFFL